MVSAGFSGGTGLIILPNGTAVDVTPPDMDMTLVAPQNSCAWPGNVTSQKDMNDYYYTLTPADIATGWVAFTFQYTNALVQDGQCNNHAGFSSAASCSITPATSCSINPPTNSVRVGDAASFAVATNGPGPCTYRWSGPNGFVSTNKTIAIASVQAQNAGVYTATATDGYGCSTTAACRLALAPFFTQQRIFGSELILSGAGGLPNGPYTILTTTNLAAANWVAVSTTNRFGADGRFTFTNLIDGTAKGRWFRLSVQ